MRKCIIIIIIISAAKKSRNNSPHMIYRRTCMLLMQVRATSLYFLTSGSYTVAFTDPFPRVGILMVETLIQVEMHGFPPDTWCSAMKVGKSAVRAVS